MIAVLVASCAPFLLGAEAAPAAGAATATPTAVGVAAATALIVPGPSVFDVVFPLTMLLLIAVLVPTALLTANQILSKWAHGTRNTNPARNEPYESGLASIIGTATERFDIKFYLIAMLFLAFDIEVAFLYPWAVRFKHGGWEMIVLLAVFLVLLEVGYLYLYKKGALDWDR